MDAKSKPRRVALAELVTCPEPPSLDHDADCTLHLPLGLFTNVKASHDHCTAAQARIQQMNQSLSTSRDDI